MPLKNGPVVGVFSKGIAGIRFLEQFLDASAVVLHPGRAEQVDVVVGWGNKPTTARAIRFAAENHKPYWRLEDGFLRSVGTGSTSPSLSLIVDEQGVYYDASAPSRIETILNGPADGCLDPLSDEQLLSRARGCIERVTRARLSKYNDSSDSLPRALQALADPWVLVVDQTYGDASVSGGLVTPGGFDRMLEVALAENPGATVVVKTHPEVISGKKRGYLTQSERSNSRIVRIGDHVNPLRLLESASHVYTCTSQLGFEALLLGKSVSCFGAPFYSGWGLTRDHVHVPRRTSTRSVVELAAAWLLYPRYVHPVRGERCEAEDIIGHLELQRDMFARNVGTTHAYGFSPWKRGFVRRYMASPDGQLRFVRGASPRSGRALVWGRRGPHTLATDCRASGVPLSYMEDGFLRSVGLGSDLTAPASLVVDSRGLHYDPGAPSDLEQLLESAEFSEADLERARLLRQSLVELGLSKYNAHGASPLVLLPHSKGRSVLVPGQVEDDASVLLGGAGISGNLELLRAVRAARPHAHIVYKPHPDVVSKNRRGSLNQLDGLVDQIETRASLPSCLAPVDEVHTLTSLVGFEALLRGLPVYTYGQPFYAGYGLTHDREPLKRRTRQLSLDELVAGVLLRYPRYYSFSARAFVTAEDAVFELARARSITHPLLPEASRLRRQLVRLAHLLRETLLAR